LSPPSAKYLPLVPRINLAWFALRTISRAACSTCDPEHAACDIQHCQPHSPAGSFQNVSDIRCIGIETGGGDAPGLNAVIRAAVKSAILKYKWKVIGIPDGSDGLIWPEHSFELTLKSVSGILPRGGTILGATNCGNPFHYKTVENGQEVVRDISDEVVANARKLGIDAVITVGGDGSQKIAARTVPQGHEDRGRAQDHRQ
jgi:hypothetical protein